MPFEENSNKCLKIRLSSNKTNLQKKTLHQIGSAYFYFAPKKSTKYHFYATPLVSNKTSASVPAACAKLHHFYDQPAGNLKHQ
jgi:hypothetical protein